jgi:hypothetical protein
MERPRYFCPLLLHALCCKAFSIEASLILEDVDQEFRYSVWPWHFSFGLKPGTDGDLDLETIDGDRDEERDLRNAGGGIPVAGS